MSMYERKYVTQTIVYTINKQYFLNIHYVA